MSNSTAEMIGLEGFSTNFTGIGGRLKSRISDFRVCRSLREFQTSCPVRVFRISTQIDAEQCSMHLEVTGSIFSVIANVSRYCRIL